MTRDIPFTKLVGTGNDFILVDAASRGSRRLLPERAWPQVARRLCHRQDGIGADGLLVLEPSPHADVSMRVFNSDGSEAEMCGNGARCVARYVVQQRTAGRRVTGTGKQATVETKAGVLRATVRGDRVAMRMTEPKDLRLKIPVAVEGQAYEVGFVDTGVPHIVVAVNQLDAVDVAGQGRQLRVHRAFQPRGTNVNFIEPIPRHPERLRIRTYERGVEAETLACGTGAVAAAVIYALNGWPATKAGRRQILLETKGGDVLTVSLTLHRSGKAPQVTDVILEGGARVSFHGVFPWSTGTSRTKTQKGLCAC